MFYATMMVFGILVGLTLGALVVYRAIQENWRGMAVGLGWMLVASFWVAEAMLNLGVL